MTICILTNFVKIFFINKLLSSGHLMRSELIITSKDFYKV